MPKLAAFLDIHTCGQMVVRPLAYTSTPPPNGAEIVEWSEVQAMPACPRCPTRAR